MTYTAPATAQFGDLLIAVMAIGESNNGPSFNPPAGWTLLPLANHNNGKALVSTDTSGNVVTSYLAAYIYGSQPGDTGTYDFSITKLTHAPEVAGWMVAYRGASTNIANLQLNGYLATADAKAITAKALTPTAKEQTLMTFFVNNVLNNDNEGNEDSWSFGPPTGAPTLTAQTPLVSSGTGAVPFLAADVPVTIANVAMGPYTLTGKVGLNWAYNLLIPE